MPTSGAHMRRTLGLSISIVVAFVGGCTTEQSPAPPGPSSTRAGDAALRIEADVRFLADDLLEGREAGTRGHELAALYVAQRMRATGLEPAGEQGSYYQVVPMLRATRVADGSRLEISRNGRTTSLAFRDQFLPALNFQAAAARVQAPAVFVGQAVHAPELQHDDFAGVDVRGKVALLFAGSPARFDNDRRAFHASTRQKLAALAERGAVGAVFVGTDDDESRTPWSRSADSWDRPGMRLRDEHGRGIDTFPQLRVVASVSAAAADALLAGSGHDAPELFALARKGALPAFELPGTTITLEARTRIDATRSRNVVARLPGGDPASATEHVVYTAHLDHVGVGAPVAGDAIYNGALDNALGVAVMLETARELAWAETLPKRSMLFIAVTAEEKGLLGAEWFVRSPTVPRESLVANINVDMPVLLTPTDDVVPIGLEHSTLQPLVEAAASELGVALSPDPFPEQNVFVRSDQYAFIRAGIPAVYLKGGVQASQRSGDANAIAGFMRERYHQPGDDLTQSIQYADAARLARLNARIGALIADAQQRPEWNEGDFFGERFGRQVVTQPTAE